MRLLIAGWHGQIARALVELAPARAGISAMTIGRPALDLCTPSAIRSTLIAARPDVMINTAAYTAVDRAESEPEAAHLLNCRGAAAFAELAASKGIPVIHLSTHYVFDGRKADPYREDDAAVPGSVFGRTKLAGERAVAAANPEHLILRTSWIYSPFGRNFATTMLALARERSEIGVVDDQVGCPTHALHVAEAILDLAERIARDRAGVPWGTYHIACGDGVSWCAFARRIFDLSAALGGPTAKVAPITTAEFPTAAPRLRNARLDSGRLDRAFGIRLPGWERDLEACIGRVLAESEGRVPVAASFEAPVTRRRHSRRGSTGTGSGRPAGS